MAPLFHEFDRTTYPNIIPHYLADLNCIPKSILDHFQKGAFTVSIRDYKWSSVALDENHEMCINKDVKAAISKVTWDFIARITPYLPYRAKTLKNFRSELGLLSLEKSNSLLDHSDKLTDKNIRMFILAINASINSKREYPPRATPGVLHLSSVRVPEFVLSALPGGRTYYLLSKYQVVS